MKLWEMCTDQAAPELAELGNRVVEKRNAGSWWLSLLGSPSKVRVWKFVLSSAFRAFPPGSGAKGKLMGKQGDGDGEGENIF